MYSCKKCIVLFLTYKSTNRLWAQKPTNMITIAIYIFKAIISLIMLLF